MARSMGFDFGLQKNYTCYKRKFRWLFTIPGVSADSGALCLPPQKSARPNLAFKEMQAEHLTETIYYPSKPDYKPIQVTLYDLYISRSLNPVWDWVTACYNAGKRSSWTLAADGFLERCNLELYDGCGNIIEEWVFEGVFPQQIDFGDLDMGSSEVVTCDLTLRYARAYLIDSSAATSPSGVTPS